MFHNIFHREYYLDRIRGFYKTDLIKVITGIRRCGKSSFMKSIMNELLSNGLPQKDILYFDLDKRGYRGIKTADQLDKIIEDAVTDGDYKYLFIDEVQNVKDFEVVINGWREEGNISIFITGSNSYLLSGELATKLTGRYVEFEMFPLNFKEYLGMKHFMGLPVQDKQEEFEEYLFYGGFPKTLEYNRPEDKEQYLQEVLHQIIDKDIRYKKIHNWHVFDKVMTYIINNYGASVSVGNLVKHFQRNEAIAIKPETIHRYLEILESAKIIYKCERFDIKSRASLQGGQKYYLADLGIYFARNVDVRINYGPALENLMFTYLRSKGYKVNVGRIGKLECDFICRHGFNDYFYVQVSRSIADEHTEEREYRALETINDNYPKYVFTLDWLLQKRNGIRHMNLIDFIGEGKDF